jgi:hypothetical protein
MTDDFVAACRWCGRGAAAKPEGKREKRVAAEQNKVAVVVLGVAASVLFRGKASCCLLLFLHCCGYNSWSFLLLLMLA